MNLFSERRRRSYIVVGASMQRRVLSPRRESIMITTPQTQPTEGINSCPSQPPRVQAALSSSSTPRMSMTAAISPWNIRRSGTASPTSPARWMRPPRPASGSSPSSSLRRKARRSSPVPVGCDRRGALRQQRRRRIGRGHPPRRLGRAAVALRGGGKDGRLDRVRTHRRLARARFDLCLQPARPVAQRRVVHAARNRNPVSGDRLSSVLRSRRVR